MNITTKPVVNLAVIGCGYWGSKIISKFLNHRRVRLSWCCDINRNVLKQIHTQYPQINTSTDYHKIATDPTLDAIIIATPPSFHYTITKWALIAGKHVLLEKPMAKYQKQASELFTLANKQNLILQVDNTFLHSAEATHLREYLSSTHPSLRSYQSFRTNMGTFPSDTNVLWDLAPHDISLLLFLVNAHPTSINAQTIAYNQSKNPSSITLRINYRSFSAFIYLNWVYPQKTRLIVISTSKQLISYDDTLPQDKIKIWDFHNSKPQTKINLLSDPPHSPTVPKYEPLAKVCDHFINSITSPRQSTPDNKLNQNIVSILEVAQKSLNNQGKTYKISI